MGSATQLPRDREQVAAVCYRLRERDVEFLLVQSRSGRWIFPKGSIEPGLTRAQSAALEAFEEAGVRGRIETVSFSRYTRRHSGDGGRSQARRAGAGTIVYAYLCEVHELVAPQESNRNRTWLSSLKAKRRLQQKRTSELGEELAGVIDRAVSRIRRLRAENSALGPRDALRQARLEAHDSMGSFSRTRAAALIRYFRGEQLATHCARHVISPESFRQAQLQLGSGSRSPHPRNK